MDKRKDGKYYIYYNKKDAVDFYTRIKAKDYTILKTLKDDNRSLVEVIRINGKRYVLKIPKEKNKRKWQRFISLFRGGESMRECEQLEKLMLNGFNAPRPYLALEKRIFGMTIDSLSISEYIESRPSTEKDIDMICNSLKEIHTKGFLHGDSQIENFLINDNRIYLIDCKLLKNIYGKFGEMYEYIYLKESCSIDLEKYINIESFYFKGAKILNSYLHWWGNFRKKLKNKG